MSEVPLYARPEGSHSQKSTCTRVTVNICKMLQIQSLCWPGNCLVRVSRLPCDD